MKITNTDYNTLFDFIQFPIEVRIPRARGRATVAGYFDNLDDLKSSIKSWDGKANIYMTINPVPSDLMARSNNKLKTLSALTGDNDIPRLKKLLIDVDPPRPAGISATDEEKTAAVDKARAIRDFILATYGVDSWLADSGNGAHVIIEIDQLNTPENVANLRAVLNYLGALFDDQQAAVDKTTFNPSRITKLYGTKAVKGDNIMDRPHRQSGLIECPASLDPQDLKGLINDALTCAQEEKKKRQPQAPAGKGIDAGEWLAKYGIEVAQVKLATYGKIYVLEACPMDQTHEQNQASSLIQLPNGALKFSCFHDRCRDYTWRDLREKYEPGCYDSDFDNLPPNYDQFGGRKKSGELPRELGEIKKKPWPDPMDDAAFYGLAGEVVETLEPYSEADNHALLVTFLTMIGSLIHRKYFAPVAADQHFCNLFSVIVGNSAKGRKGMSANLILQLLESVDERWAKTRVTGGLSSGEGLIFAVRDPVFTRVPIKEKGRVKDYEEVLTDSGVSDKRLMVLETEFAQALRVMARQGNTLSPVVRQAWDKGNLNTLIKNDRNRATDAHISIIGHITIHELMELLQNAEAYNGFANRFLWILSTRSKLLPDGAIVPDSVQNQLVYKINKVVSFAGLHDVLNDFEDFESDSCASQGKVPFVTEPVERDPAARKYWRALYEELAADVLGLYGAVTARAEAQVLRLSLIYAILDCSTVIKTAHIKAARAVWDYADRSAQYIFAGQTANSDAQEILIALEAAGGQLSQTEISNCVFQRNTPSAVIKNAIAELLETDRIEKVEEQTGGRPRILWKLRPTNADK
ncbi:MAG: DUF3987 domain-containing protein [Syntrophomonadaceae bacterium]|jgi:hypothetical protein|nr:DUF3987 domain-containing protein [Syntrophomonadaceae bacterium]